MIIICASVLNPAAVFSTDVSCTLVDFPFSESKCKQEASLFKGFHILIIKAFLLGFYCKCRFCFSQQHRVILFHCIYYSFLLSQCVGLTAHLRAHIFSSTL